jgi:hypothetical protein
VGAFSASGPSVIFPIPLRRSAVAAAVSGLAAPLAVALGAPPPLPPSSPPSEFAAAAAAATEAAATPVAAELTSPPSTDAAAPLRGAEQVGRGRQRSGGPVAASAPLARYGAAVSVSSSGPSPSHSPPSKPSRTTLTRAGRESCASPSADSPANTPPRAKLGSAA